LPRHDKGSDGDRADVQEDLDIPVPIVPGRPIEESSSIEPISS